MVSILKLDFNKNKEKKETAPSETPVNKPEVTNQSKTGNVQSNKPSNVITKIDNDVSKTNLSARTIKQVPETQTKTQESTITNTTSQDENAKKLLNFMNQSKKKEITPYINFKENRVSFPILINIGLDEYNVKFLESLTPEAVGILEKGVYERQLVCPKHPDELSTGIRLYCPECSSMDVERLHLIEHKVCGFIAEKEKYGVDDVRHVQKCPHCKKQIEDYNKEIRLPGRWNKCHSCSKIFDNVVIKLRCRKYEHDFDVTEAESVSIPSYKLKENAMENVGIMTILSPLKKILTSADYAVEELTTVLGKSGVEHPVSIFAKKDNQRIAIFVETSKGQIQDTEINSTLVKVLDIAPSKTIFIAIPSISEQAKTMGEAHGMIILSGDNNEKILPLFQNEFSKPSTIEDQEPTGSTDAPKKIT